jgi:hypothetical protein
MRIEMPDLIPPGRLVEFFVLDMLALKLGSDRRGLDVRYRHQPSL